VKGGERILSGHVRLVAVTPETTVHDGPVDFVVVPAHDGEVAFLPGHAPYVGLLGAGEMRFHEPQGGTRHYFLEGGVVQTADDVVNVLADSVVPVEDLDEATARADLDRALATPATDDEAQRARQKRADAARAKIRLATRGSASHRH
jgi:F-type H+-transporting ATPase subunit epsilon